MKTEVNLYKSLSTLSLIKRGNRMAPNVLFQRRQRRLDSELSLLWMLTTGYYLLTFNILVTPPLTILLDQLNQRCTTNIFSLWFGSLLACLGHFAVKQVQSETCCGAPQSRKLNAIRVTQMAISNYVMITPLKTYLLKIIVTNINPDCNV